MTTTRCGFCAVVTTVSLPPAVDDRLILDHERFDELAAGGGVVDQMIPANVNQERVRACGGCCSVAEELLAGRKLTPTALKRDLS